MRSVIAAGHLTAFQSELEQDHGRLLAAHDLYMAQQRAADESQRRSLVELLEGPAPAPVSSTRHLGEYQPAPYTWRDRLTSLLYRTVMQ